ncbi:MAG TPA: PEGA domain-containing protein [Armatimonadota bacterium]|nr:PEGA domain-containing protein [Armatimonadota bacterium]
MVDPKKLLEKLPRFDKDKPFRYLGRRVVKVMVEAATANLVLGQRTAPGRYLVVRLVGNVSEKEDWEQQFAESRASILREVEREAATREVQIRSALDLDLLVLTDADVSAGEAERLLSTLTEPDDLPEVLARLMEEREVILSRRVRSMRLESDPPEAQVYLDHRPVGVTPCQVDAIPEGEHTLTFSRRGYLLYEDTLRVAPGQGAQRLTYRAVLEPEPEMGVLEVRTFPPRARVTIGGETRDSPTEWRLPAGWVELRIEMDEFEPQNVRVYLPPTPETRPHRVQVRLSYNGPQRDEVVGRLIVYKPGVSAPPREVREEDPATSRIRSFFQETDPADDLEWEPVEPEPTHDDRPVVLGERPLQRGVLLIGRADPGSELAPDIRLFDPENSVSRGCHAWLWVYADRSTGADYNTFLIGNNSPAGIRVDGALVMETRRLSPDSEIEIGNFRMRLVKETPAPRVEF